MDLEKNIKAVLSKADRKKPIGPTNIQRLAGVGYNQALHTLDEMVEQGLITQENPYTYRWVN